MVGPLWLGHVPSFRWPSQITQSMVRSAYVGTLLSMLKHSSLEEEGLAVGGGARGAHSVVDAQPEDLHRAARRRRRTRLVLELDEC